MLFKTEIKFCATLCLFIGLNSKIAKQNNYDTHNNNNFCFVYVCFFDTKINWSMHVTI